MNTSSVDDTAAPNQGCSRRVIEALLGLHEHQQGWRSPQLVTYPHAAAAAPNLHFVPNPTCAFLYPCLGGLVACPRRTRGEVRHLSKLWIWTRDQAPIPASHCDWDSRRVRSPRC